MWNTLSKYIYGESEEEKDSNPSFKENGMALGKLFLENNKTHQNELKLENAFCSLTEVGEFEYTFDIKEKSNETVLSQPIETMNVNYSNQDHSINWIYIKNDNDILLWTFVFFNEDEEKDFKTFLAIKLFEHARKMSFQKALGNEPEASNWIVKTSSDEVKSEVQEGNKMDLEYDTVSHQDDQINDEDQNSGLSMSTNYNRTFVIRGSKIGVFKHDDQDTLQYLSKIPIVESADGVFDIGKSMLIEKDTKMILTNPEKKNKLYSFDLERGKIVQEYKARDEMPVVSIAPLTKYSQRSGEFLSHSIDNILGETNYLGVNSGNLFTIDPRSNTTGALYRYSKPEGFSSIATTGDGNIAIGSDKGEIRLFTDVGKRAKTCFPGLGQPIIGIDTTEDGRWVLATSQKYILLIPTILASGKTAFRQPMSAENRPTPFKLQIHNRDLVYYKILSVNFTPAHFDTGESIRESWIVSSTGPYIIIWKLADIVSNRLYNYRIKHCQTNVVDDQFRFNMDNQVVVALPNNVYSQKRIPK